MTVAVTVLAALLVVAVALLAVQRRRHQSLVRAAEQQRVELAQRVTVAEGEREAAAADAAAERQARQSAEERVASVTSDLEAAQRAVAEGDEAAERLRRELAETIEQRDHLRQQLASVVASGDADALWALELARSERTWRHSVALSPGAESPFVAADDPLRLAVEVEAAALREEVGAPLEVRWQADVRRPADALLVLRLAQELLAQAARAGMAAVLRVEGAAQTGDVVLTLDNVDDDDPAPQVVIPPLPDSVASVEDGSTVRVRNIREECPR